MCDKILIKCITSQIEEVWKNCLFYWDIRQHITGSVQKYNKNSRTINDETCNDGGGKKETERDAKGKSEITSRSKLMATKIEGYGGNDANILDTTILVGMCS